MLSNRNCKCLAIVDPGILKSLFAYAHKGIKIEHCSKRPIELEVAKGKRTEKSPQRLNVFVAELLQVGMGLNEQVTK